MGLAGSNVHSSITRRSVADVLRCIDFAVVETSLERRVDVHSAGDGEGAHAASWNGLGRRSSDGDGLRVG